MPVAAPDPTAWAAREIGLPIMGAPAEVRTAFLRELERDGPVPPPHRQQAWQVLLASSGSLAPCPPAALVAAEARLRAEIDDFAGSLFATPVKARRQRWRELSGACAFSPPLAARLAALEPGLDLDLGLATLGDPRTAQLASHVAGLFVLAPAARAAQRQAVLRAMEADIAAWEETAQQLVAASPALAALEPALLTSIRGWREQQQRLIRLRAGRQYPGRRPAVHAAPCRAAAPPPPAPPSRGSGRAGIWVAVVAGGLMLRICLGGLGSHSSSPPPPQIDLHKFDADGADRARRMFHERDRINLDAEKQKRLRDPVDDDERLERQTEEFNKQLQREIEKLLNEQDAKGIRATGREK